MLNMKALKGYYSDNTSYNVGDVVIDTSVNGVYHLQKPCAKGTKPADNRYWGQLNQIAAEIVLLFAGQFADLWSDVADLQTAVASIPKNIDAESISLKSGDDEYLITVDATGDTPELAVEKIVEEDEGDGD